jgi:hypothetical protein
MAQPRCEIRGNDNGAFGDQATLHCHQQHYLCAQQQL